MNYVVANRVYVKPEFCEQFEQRFKNRAGEIDKQEGFVKMEVLKPVSEQTPYVVLTHWQDEAAFKHWVGSEDFKIAHQNPMPKEAFLDGGSMEQHEVVVYASSNL
ncbi:hypothetical protein MNBD_GAMMA12-1593 [hydrothermal vent metagenome]|uniref:ABM domain-containing protein n=1 Tax=hydrothermal vent metagenome TaxID=652676 RepID=A0A3B0YJN9_9ZZZZ